MANNTLRKLDTHAKIFALSCNSKDTSIFRLSITLKKKVNKDILKKAVEITLKQYQPFKVKVKRTLTNYYLEENNSEIIIHNETDDQYNKINTIDNNEYLFKVRYQGKNINIDFFHLLTDGSGGLSFFKTVIYNYIDLLNKKEISSPENEIICDNSYIKYYDKKHKKTYNYPISYQLKGQKLNRVKTSKLTVNLHNFKEQAKLENSSISMYLASLITYALYKTNYKQYKGKKPINLCIPISLKKFFDSNTSSNFISHMMVSLNLIKEKSYTLKDFITMVKKEFNKKLTKEEVTATSSSNTQAINNKLIDLIPLFIKKPLVVVGSYFVKKHFTITMSNIGDTNIDNKYLKYIKDCSFIVEPDWAERIRIGVCTIKNKLIITINSNINDNSLEEKFQEILKKLKINYKIEVL